ncbi:hypothetical protein D9M73_68900 [compost metagenome]
MIEAFVIINLAEAHQWDERFGRMGEARTIPEKCRPTILQCDRETAEQECIRLAKAHLHGCFVIFEATQVAVQIDCPTHVTLAGETMFSKRILRLAKVGDDLPF